MKYKEQVALAPLTTIKLGGPARYFKEVTSVEELGEALRWAEAEQRAVHILGGGSNTIFADQGFDGVVIKMGIKGVNFQGEVVTAAAGEEWEKLVEAIVKRGLAGLECLSGIPGLVGGTPLQNVGAYGQEVAQTIVEVKALERQTLNKVVFKNRECQFSYRSSRFKHKEVNQYVVYEVVFRLKAGGKPCTRYPQVAEVVGASPSLQEVREAVLKLRRSKGMVIDERDINTRSCGSFFVNPSTLKLRRTSPLVPTFIDSESGEERIPAAWLVEQAGFPKGFRREGVGISEKHNLALVNYGGTTEELLALEEEIQEKVQEKFGIRLAREPVVV
jgi:UDP-N-acetylmuramate dehydrogenase